MVITYCTCLKNSKNPVGKNLEKERMAYVGHVTRTASLKTLVEKLLKTQLGKKSTTHPTILVGYSTFLVKL